MGYDRTELVHIILQCAWISLFVLGIALFMVTVINNQREAITINKEIKEMLKSNLFEDLFDANQEIVLTCLLNDKETPKAGRQSCGLPNKEKLFKLMV